MGLADLPRIHVRGSAAWNPSTVNNNDAQPTYDPASAELSWPWMAQHGLAAHGDVDRYLTEPILDTPNVALLQGVDPTSPPAEWNYYGGNTCCFLQPDEPVIEWPEKFRKPAGTTAVTAWTGPDGARRSADPVVGLPLQLNVGLDAAKLVDVDPVCPWSSQIFADSLTLGSTARGAGFTGATAGRAHARWLYFRRNLNLAEDVHIAGVASAMWQLAMPTDTLEWFDDAPAPGTATATLRAALDRPGTRGLLLRVTTYRTVYFQGAAFDGRDVPDWPGIIELYREYREQRLAWEAGERSDAPPVPVNRAYSTTIGWIAPWTDADLRSMAADRTLVPSPGVPYRPAGQHGLPAWPLGPASLACAVAADDPGRIERISLDLGSCVPEVDASLEKVDVGVLELSVPGSGDPTPFARLTRDAYARAAYEDGVGVVDLDGDRLLRPLTTDDLAHAVVVTASLGGAPPARALTEAPYTAETDDRGVYLDEPGADGQGTATIRFQVRHLGRKPPPGTRVRVSQYTPSPPGFGEGGWGLVSATAPDRQAPYVRFDAPGVEDGASVVLDVAHVDDGLPYATVDVTVTALRPGTPNLDVVPVGPGGAPPPAAETISLPAIASRHYAVVRVLPFHEQRATAFANWLRTGPTADVVTQRVFDEVFRTYFLLYPVMRFIRDPLQLQAWRGRVCEATDPAIFDRADYMPVTRALSAGQRRMLLAWNDHLDGDPPVRDATSSLGRRG